MTLLQRNTKNQLKCDAVVIGWGLTGQSVARFLLKKGVRSGCYGYEGETTSNQKRVGKA